MQNTREKRFLNIMEQKLEAYASNEFKFILPFPCDQS